jgi:hypothetical protein
MWPRNPIVWPESLAFESFGHLVDDLKLGLNTHRMGLLSNLTRVSIKRRF